MILLIQFTDVITSYSIHYTKLYEIAIQSQVKGTGSVPDGLLESNFSFRLFVESKIATNSINEKQLAGHKSQIKSNTDFLIYLTPDDSKPDILGQVNWSNWITIINIFNDYLQSSQSDNKQLLRITSYNVCYTKLLRLSVKSAGIKGLPKYATYLLSSLTKQGSLSELFKK